MPSVTEIAREKDYWITVHRAAEEPTRQMVVTFGGQPSGLGASGFGTDFLLRHGIDTIHVAQAHGTQYQGLSVEAFAEAVGPVVTGSADVLTYGSSLGGYAALFYGGVINARIIAAAPMFPAWRPLRNRAYATLDVRHPELCDVPRSRHAPVVIYDPELSRDSFVVAQMVGPAYPEFRAVTVPHGGHQVLMALERAKLLKPLILGLIERGDVIDFARPAEGTAIWHGERGLSLRNSHPDQALRELERSLAIRPSKRYFNEMVKLLIRAGRVAEAQAAIDEALRSGERQHVLVPSMRRLAAEASLTLTDTLPQQR